MNVLALAKTKNRKVKTHFEELFHSFSNQLIRKAKPFSKMFYRYIHACNLQKRTLIFHKKNKAHLCVSLVLFCKLQAWMGPLSICVSLGFDFVINWLEKLWKSSWKWVLIYLFFVFAKARTFMGSSPSFCHK